MAYIFTQISYVERRIQTALLRRTLAMSDLGILRTSCDRAFQCISPSDVLIFLALKESVFISGEAVTPRKCF